MILLDDNSNGMKNYSPAIVLQMFKTLQMEKLVRSKKTKLQSILQVTSRKTIKESLHNKL